MTAEILIVFIIIFVAIILFATEIISIDLTAMVIMVTLMLTSLVSPQEGISGFSSSATITVLALFILGAGLQATGAVNLIGRYMIYLIGKSRSRALFVILLVVGVISAFINNTAVVVIFLPIVFRISNFTRTSASKFLMPLSFAAMIGGASTVIGTSTNILVSEIYATSTGGEAFSIFEFISIGGIVFVAFFIYMYFLGDRLISSRRKEESLTEQYKIKDYLTEIIIRPHSPLVGKRLNETFLVNEIDAEVLEIMHENGNVWLPNQIERLQANDVILLKVNLQDILTIQDQGGVAIRTRDQFGDEDLKSNETTLMELVVAPNSKIARKKVREVDFKSQYGAIPLAIRRRGINLKQQLSDVDLRFGDDILLEVKKESLGSIDRSPDFILMQEIEKPVFDRSKLLLSVLIVLGVVIVAALNIMPILVSSLTGCVLMFLTQCITIREAYRQVEWKFVFLLAGMIPLGVAMEKTGAGQLIADNLLQFVGSFGITVVIAVLFLITSMLTSIMSNNATAILLAPIAIGMAQDMGIDPKAFLVTIMFAANTSFITPVGYQTNTLIYGPGNYKFSDFFKVGGILTLIILVVVTASVRWLYI